MPLRSYKTVGEFVVTTKGVSKEEEQAEGSQDYTRVERTREERRIRRKSMLSELAPLLGNKDEDKQQQQKQRKKEINDVWGALYGQSALQKSRPPDSF